MSVYRTIGPLVFSHCMSMGANDPRGLVVSEKKIFYVFPMTPPWAGPVWTLGVWLAGFIKKTTTHCYIQNIKALGLVVSEKKILFIFFPLCVYGS